MKGKMISSNHMGISPQASLAISRFHPQPRVQGWIFFVQVRPHGNLVCSPHGASGNNKISIDTSIYLPSFRGGKSQ